MKKQILLFMAVVGSALITSAQYTPLVNEDNTWRGRSFGWVLQNYFETFDGDSIIEGVTYKKMWYQNVAATEAYQTALIREDVAAQQVFIYTGEPGSEEQLLYDFTLEAGDVVTVWGVGSPQTITITSVGTTTVGGTERKKFNFTDAMGAAYWIEGIGSMYGIKDAALGNVADYNPNVTCFYEGNDLAWSNPTNDTPCDLFLGVHEQEESFDMTIGPNPANDVLNIFCPSSLAGKNVDVRIFSGTGQLMLNKQVNLAARMQVDLPDMSEGLYLIIFSASGKTLAAEQFIKQGR